MALTPILLYWSARAGGASGIWVLYACFWVAGLALLCGRFGHESFGRSIRQLSNIPVSSVVIALLWFAIAICALADLQIGDRLYYSVMTYDHGFRTELTDAITRTGIPPANPFQFTSGPTPMRYHYFWYAICSFVERMGGATVNARSAVAASTVWCGYALMCLVALFLRFFDRRGADAIRRRSLIGIGLLAVTGLDILPTALTWLRNEVLPEMEWWNEQVTSWTGTTLWNPHSTAALVCGLMGFLIVWHAVESRESMRGRAINAVLAGVAFASMTGCSIYVAIVVAAALLVWSLFALRKGWRQHALILAVAGLAAAGLAVPYLLQLTRSGSVTTPLMLTVRNFKPLWELMNRFHITSGFAVVGLLLLALPLNYFLELGFFFLVGILKLRDYKRRRNVSTQGAAEFCMAGTALLLCTFVRSNVINNNDLGWRGFLLVQFVLLLWGVDLLDELWRHRRPDAIPRSWKAALAICLVLGVSGTLYELVVTRFYFWWADHGAVALYCSPDRQLGKRTFALRTVYEHLAKTLPKTAILQDNPEQPCDTDFPFGLYANRQTVAYGMNCGVAFGGDVKECADAVPFISALFQAGPGADFQNVESVCRRFKIDALIVSDADPVWKEPHSWVWQGQALAAAPHARAVFCRDLHAPSTALNLK